MAGSDKAQWAAYVAAALLLLIGGGYLLRADDPPASAGGQNVSVDAPGEGAGTAGAEPARGPKRGEPVYVHVAGEVRRPGIYRVPAGSRVAAAVRRAGGLSRRADLTAFNLAAGVRDAQQVIVPRRGDRNASQRGVAAGAAGGAQHDPNQPISLAGATSEQLQKIEGIGPKLAEAIIGYRDQHRGIKSIEQLREVDGIGEKRFETLRKAVKP